jgi:ribosome biogenesis GTPase
LPPNIDQILIVAGISKPRTSLGFIDRCILAAECFHIPIKIILNKIDIHTDKDNQVLEKWQAIYQNVGYDLITCSATRGDNLEIINTAIRNKTTLICGHSGVGKSSLLNALHPQLSIRTQKISSKWSKGMHTTTFAHMHILDENTFLIDTPGIKEFFNIEIEPNELAGYFVEFKPFLNKCAFHNCLHQNEQQCAIKTAVSNDEIFADRYINYLNILDQLQNVNYWERM